MSGWVKWSKLRQSVKNGVTGGIHHYWQICSLVIKFSTTLWLTVRVTSAGGQTYRRSQTSEWTTEPVPKTPVNIADLIRLCWNDISTLPGCELPCCVPLSAPQKYQQDPDPVSIAISWVNIESDRCGWCLKWYIFLLTSAATAASGAVPEIYRTHWLLWQTCTEKKKGSLMVGSDRKMTTATATELGVARSKGVIYGLFSHLGTSERAWKWLSDREPWWKGIIKLRLLIDWL